MKRILIALVLGTLLALNVASVAAARVSIIGLPNADVIPDSGSTRAVIETGSRLSARLRALDAVLYPDSFGAEGAWHMPSVTFQVADAEGYFVSYF